MVGDDHLDRRLEEAPSAICRGRPGLPRVSSGPESDRGVLDPESLEPPRGAFAGSGPVGGFFSTLCSPSGVRTKAAHSIKDYRFDLIVHRVRGVYRMVGAADPASRKRESGQAAGNVRTTSEAGSCNASHPAVTYEHGSRSTRSLEWQAASLLAVVPESRGPNGRSAASPPQLPAKSGETTAYAPVRCDWSIQMEFS